jgi:hypothetical protein
MDGYYQGGGGGWPTAAHPAAAGDAAPMLRSTSELPAGFRPLFQSFRCADWALIGQPELSLQGPIAPNGYRFVPNAGTSTRFRAMYSTRCSTARFRSFSRRRQVWWLGCAPRRVAGSCVAPRPAHALPCGAGSGKTVVMELAILRLLSAHLNSAGEFLHRPGECAGVPPAAGAGPKQAPKLPGHTLRPDRTCRGAEDHLPGAGPGSSPGEVPGLAAAVRGAGRHLRRDHWQAAREGWLLAWRRARAHAGSI